MDGHCNEIGTSWEHSGLEDTQEEAGGKETAQAMDEALCDGDETETKHH